MDLPNEPPANLSNRSIRSSCTSTASTTTSLLSSTREFSTSPKQQVESRHRNLKSVWLFNNISQSLIRRPVFPVESSVKRRPRYFQRPFQFYNLHDTMLLATASLLLTPRNSHPRSLPSHLASPSPSNFPPKPPYRSHLRCPGGHYSFSSAHAQFPGRFWGGGILCLGVDSSGRCWRGVADCRG